MARLYKAVEFANADNRRDLSRAAQRGQLVRLASGIYTSQIEREPRLVVRDAVWDILAHEMPGAVIVDRSAKDGGRGSTGVLYVVAGRVRPLELPGLVIVPRSGPGEQPGDMPLPGGIAMSSHARALLDNLAPSRRDAAGRSRTLTRAEVERWIDELCATRGGSYLNRVRDAARELAPVLGRSREMTTLDALISAALTTGDRIVPVSAPLAARAAGKPYDTVRLEAFARLVTALDGLAPSVVPALPEDATRRTLLPFYEAYFSNYIEGTEFTLDEAAGIVFDGQVPEARPDDAHDIIGTYQLTSDTAEMERVPRDADDLLEMLAARHRVILAGRPDKSPGRFKTRANQAGSTVFVAPDLVEGTLRAGFETGASLVSPFARAVYAMFLVSEIHPFTDGNGRVARIFMNAELARAGEVRIVVPTVFRDNYIDALKAATQTANDAALIAALDFARRWTAKVDFTDRSTAEADLTRTNATREAREAAAAGVRLTLP